MKDPTTSEAAWQLLGAGVFVTVREAVQEAEVLLFRIHEDPDTAVRHTQVAAVLAAFRERVTALCVVEECHLQRWANWAAQRAGLVHPGDILGP